MVGVTCGIATTVVGAVLVVIVSIVGYVAVPRIISNVIESEVVLIEDSIQLERFETVPFPLQFSVRVWNMSNPEQVMAGGVASLREVGPYVYKLYQRRLVHDMDEELIRYRIVLNLEFDAEASFPNTEEDLVTIVNVPYHAILQVAESMFPALMPALAAGLNGIFGAENNRPVVTVRVRDLLFDGIRMCSNPGGLVGSIACGQIRGLSGDANNMQEQDDGSLIFSLLAYRDNNPSQEYVVHRGLEDSALFGRIDEFAGLPHLLYWQDGEQGPGSGVCNMINGTDSGVFAPFVDRNQPLFALNTDICRSVRLQHQYDTEYEGIPVARFTANEWFLDNNEGCFCLNVTSGVTADDGCLLQGAMELFTCVGAYLVLSYPHFLYADSVYRNGVIGMNPVEEDHRIYVDMDPHTGTVVRGFRRAQFNVFMRPITGIAATQNLRTALTPFVWFQEGMSLPDEFVEELSTKLLRPLNIVSILIPVLVAISALVLLIGLIFLIRAKCISVTPAPMPRTSETKIPE